MSGLVEFLRARLDEDEALAREAPPGPWYIGNAVDPTQPCSVHTFPGVRLVADGLNWLVAEHIARQNPSRVLADVAAKRAIVDEHPDVNDGDCGICVTGRWGYPTHGGSSPQRHPCRTLRLLAAPFAAHPDYDERWKP
ncbi:DUF6221 family protein [Streptomyces sp. LUP30]|uniref:DUF6221 family protein n=1 Tax=Streptomyces sp. LUP30 TaxID=1890285 RepID=UPI00114CC579|nr:DUF6221 family protein [Streptomyces sp. LUP30]